MGVGWKFLRHLFLLHWEKKISQWNFTKKVTRIPFINVTIFQLMTSLDHFWWVNKLPYVQWPGATQNSSQRHFKAFHCSYVLQAENMNFLHFSSNFFFQFKISAFTYFLHSWFFGEKSQLSLKGLLKSFCTYLTSVLCKK